MAMAAVMRTECREHPNRVYETLDLTIAGTTLQFGPAGSGGTIRTGGGHYLPGLISRTAIPRKLSWPSTGLFEPRVTFKIQDTKDRDIQKLVGGPAQGQVNGGTASMYWRSNSVAAASHYQVIDGEIKDFRVTSERTFEFTVGVRDAPLRSQLKIPTLSRAIWPLIPEENEDLPGYIYLGNWISTGVPDANGMAEATLVDEVNGIWYVSYGIMGDVTNINVDGVSDSDWTVIGTGTIGVGPYVQAGRPYTVLQDDAGTLRTTANTVTCDVVGPEKQGDGSESTTLLDDPANMLRIALANFAFNDWPVGAPTPTAGSWAWFSQTTADSNTPMNVESNDDADADFFGAMNSTASMLLTSDDTGYDVINAWSKSFRCPVGWDIPFEIVTKPIILNERSAYPSELVSRFLNEIRRTEGQSTTKDIVTALKTTYIYNSAEGTFARQRIDGNRFTSDKIDKSYEFTYGPAESV